MGRKMRCFLCFLILIVLLYGISGAESFFPDLPSLGKESEILAAPSYSGMTGIDPDLVTVTEDRKSIVTYEKVFDDDYYSFGSYLNALGYSIADSIVNEEEASVLLYLTKDDISFEMLYERRKNRLTLTYPENVSYEQYDYLSAYLPITLGQEIKIKDLGIFTFLEFDLDYPYSHLTKLGGTLYTALRFGFLNESGGNLVFRSYYDREEPPQNDFMTVTLHFYDAEGYHCMLPGEAYGRSNIYHNKDGSVSKDIVESSGTVYSNQYGEYGFGFYTTQEQRRSEDGMIALTIDMKNGEKYKIIIKEYGRDLY